MLQVLVSVLDLVPRWVWVALVVALSATSCKLKLDVGGLQLEVEKARTSLAKAHHEAAQTRAQAAAAAASATTAYRALEARWRTTQETIDREARARQDQIRTAAAGAAVAGDGLRIRAAATAAAACGGGSAGGSSAAAVGPAASSPGAVLADVLGRLEAAGRQLAEVADARGLAGASCERAYDSLRAR